MDEQCYIGQFVTEVCHNSCYGLISKELKHLNEFDDCVQERFKLRVSNSVSSIYEYHEKSTYLSIIFCLLQADL